jgi:hypothetical protein
MDPTIADQFKNRPVILTFTNDFVLHGEITAIDTNGLVFKTTQRTSYISFSKIASIVPED